MPEVIVLADLLARPGRQSEAEKLLLEVLAPTHREHGCLLYAVHRAIDDPLRFAFVERWASSEDLENHMSTDHVKRALADIPKYFSAGPDLVIYESVPGGEIAKGSLAGHAGNR